MTVTPPNEPAAGAQRRAPRWMWIVLVLSVALNMIVAGMAVAAMLHFHKGHGGKARLARYVETLPAERRDKIASALEAHRDRVRPLRRELRRARRRARDAFTADPLDRAALVAAYEQIAKARIALTRARQEWLPELAEMLTLEERRQYLRRHRHGPRHRFRRD